MSLTAAQEAQVIQLLGLQTPLTSLANNEPTITSKLGAAKVNLSQLAAASVGNDSDLILVRQGTLDKSITLGLAKSVTTTAQFDNTAKAATTAFVQQSGLHFQLANGNAIAADTTLTLAQSGHWAEVQAAITVTLPDVATAQSGIVTYTFKAKTNFTLKAFGSTQQIASGLSGGNTLPVLAGETITVVSSSPSFGWYVVVNGFGSTSFGTMIGNPGYQKFPTGIVIQWGPTTNIAANSSIPIAYPMVFPNAFWSISLVVGATSSAGGGLGFNSIGTGNNKAGGTVWNQSTTVAALPGSYIAIGN